MSLQVLPLDTANFSRLRTCQRLYVDKTGLLLHLIENGDWYFLARPRRFGKTLTISTLEAMFKGETELFHALSAEKWVEAQKQKPAPVLRLDLSGLRPYTSAESLNSAINRQLLDCAKKLKLPLAPEETCEGSLIELLSHLYEKQGPVVVLIDEYDAPILKNITSTQRSQEYREVLRSFYAILKSAEEMLQFVFITGISKLTKAGIFSSLNNLYDISLSPEYGTLVGYTEKELEFYFHDYLEQTRLELGFSSKDDLIEKIRTFYDGYSFDGANKVYNPLSILSFFKEKRFSYWYDSGSTSFLLSYFKKHNIASPASYHQIHVTKDALSSSEIEETPPEIFLWQAGYLTICECKDDDFVLNYPNQEVLTALSRMYRKRHRWGD